MMKFIHDRGAQDAFGCIASDAEGHGLIVLVQGDSVKVAAYALGRAPSTVSQTARTALLKLGVRSAAELARLVSVGGP